MTNEQIPKPYPFAEGASAYRMCDLPHGWEYRARPEEEWTARNTGWTSTGIVEARPPRPATVTVPIEDVRVGDVLAEGGKVTEFRQYQSCGSLCVSIVVEGNARMLGMDAKATVPVEVLR